MEYLEAGLKLGLPIFLMSWWVHSWLMRKGLVDRSASRKETEQAVKEYKKASKESEAEQDDFWTGRWLKFGGGFYGLTALWTFIVFELKDIWWLFTNIPEVIDLISSGIWNVVGAFIVNQAMNFAQAFSWIVNWGGSGFSLIWFFASYIGFYIGMKAAQRQDIKELSSLKIFSTQK